MGSTRGKTFPLPPLLFTQRPLSEMKTFSGRQQAAAAAGGARPEVFKCILAAPSSERLTRFV